MHECPGFLSIKHSSTPPRDFCVLALMIAFKFIVVNISIGYVNPWSPFISELPKKAYQILILIQLDIRLNKPLKNQRLQEAYWILE